VKNRKRTPRLVTLACLAAAAVTLIPKQSFALKKGLCPGVVCTGGKPTLTLTGIGLPEAEVVPIYWGSVWSNASEGDHYATMLAAANGAYFSALEQYGIGRVRIAPTTGSVATDPVRHCNNGTTCNGTCSDGSQCGVSDVVKTINAQIGSGAVEPPSSGGIDRGPMMMYLVLADSTFFNGSGFNGMNAITTCDSTCGNYRGVVYSFGVAMKDNFSAITHEIAEAVAGNVGLSGCQNAGGTQVADPCQCYTSAQQGGSYDAYWSAADSACVVPEGFSTVSRHEGGTSWPQIGSFTARQVYAGTNTVIASDTNDNVQLYVSSGNWQQIGAPKAMAAVDNNDNIYGLNLHGTGVYRYNRSTGDWAFLTSPNVPFLTGLYAGKFVIVTDNRGMVWRYTGNQTWQQIGGPAAQLVVNGAGVWMTLQEHVVLEFNSTGDPNGWALEANFVSTLFPGSGNGIAVSNEDNGDIFYQYSPRPIIQWTLQSPTSSEFAITTDNNLFQLDISGNVWRSNDTSINSPNWTKLTTKKAGIRGHGNKLYALGPIAY
jgi:hypothetical protein